ncbi:MAG: ELM1/GtrOC1 family putative glycosyltransferase [Planctomycetota bacterium]
MIHIVTDGKPGHLSQSRGLAEAIARQTDAVIHEDALSGTGDGTPRSNAARTLVICAGHETHARALEHARQAGGVAIALMNPGWLKRRRFDLSVIPEHDGIPASAKVELSVGTLNTVRPATDVSPKRGLLLIGGPSKHHGWSNEGIATQLDAVIRADPSIEWTATTSRRTPEATVELLHGLSTDHDKRLGYFPPSVTPPGWVGEQLQRCGVCWVTRDSVSMVYEALTSGAAVGLLDVPTRRGRPGRVVRGIDALVAREWVVGFDAWRNGTGLIRERPRLAEADRIAEVVLQRWPSLRG